MAASPPRPRHMVALGLVRVTVWFPTALLTTGGSSRLSLESSALCVASAARMPRPSVTLIFSPSVGGRAAVGGTQALQGHSPCWRGQLGAGRPVVSPLKPPLMLPDSCPPLPQRSAFYWAVLPAPASVGMALPESST